MQARHSPKLEDAIDTHAFQNARVGLRALEGYLHVGYRYGSFELPQTG